MSYLFQSERLGFNKWSSEEEKPFAAMNADPDVMEYFPTTLTKPQSNDLISTLNRHFDDHGFTFFATSELSTGNFIGFIGLKWATFDVAFTPTVEIGWRIAHQFWGKGYATEAAKKMIEKSADWNINSIHSFTTVNNRRSEKVMIKCGMKHAGFFDHPLVGDKSPLKKHVLYRLDL